ncbi:MAG TPA: quinone oxidoreductase, partial [Longimicrobiales bacterium]|nr:quinone oxidoreductase [Longimicrobiales bacterium]
MKAIRIHEHGGPEVLKFEDVEKPALQPGHVLIRIQAIGVNFIDTYHRTGLYPVKLPLTLGQEGAGIVEEVADDVQWFRAGERVAWTNVPGAYAEFAAVPASRLVKVTEDISFDIAAATMLQGMTAHYLATSTYPLQAGDTCLVYAAAGGVGLMLTQIAKLRGATVIGTTSSKDKADLAIAAGADHVIRYDTHSVSDEVK